MASSSSTKRKDRDFLGIEPPDQIRRKVSESTALYDVFINHRGPDSKHTLAVPLYESLKELGIRAFLDLEEMELGHSFPSTIETAITSAAVHIAIFSKRYAESPWCLAELYLMLQSSAKIIPVFYEVKPWELRHPEKGAYGDAFSNYLQKSRYLEKLDEWKKALVEISYIAGYEIEKLKASDLESIVTAVQKEVKRKEPLHVAEHPVALDKLVQEFERQCLDKLVLDFETHCGLNKEAETKAKTVGIYGMGGVGKTTLCKELFNRMRHQYDRACFLLNVREASARSNLPSLQVKLLKDLFHVRGLSFESAEEGSSYIRNRIDRSRSWSFLIVLDDIDHLRQLDALPIMHILGNSLVIITTRDEGILVGERVEVRYHLKEMVEEDARQLFSLHAFSHLHPESGYEQLVEDFVRVCGGLPLSLQVLGRHVRGQSEHYWKLVLKDLVGGYLHPDIKKNLQISFDALQYEEQQIFIDIACFFVDHVKSKAISVWEASGWNAQYRLQILKDRCLVEELVEDECLFDEIDDPVPILRMHDHLRDLGREMANKRNDPPRLWRPQDLKKLESEGFQYILAHIKQRCFHSFFDKFLSSRITFLLGELDVSAAASFSLLLLQLDEDEDEDGYVSDSIPSWIPLQHIQHLRIYNGNFNTLWRQDVQAPAQLRALEISRTSLRKFPDFIGVVTDVEKEVMEGEDMAAIGGLPLLRFSPTNLQSLDSNDCRKSTTVKVPLSLLENLLISELESILEIVISGNFCPKLKSLELFCMENLTQVRFSNCEYFEKLNCLKISNCEELKRLSVTANLKLEEINISDCPQLEEVSLDRMGYLKRITIANCNLKNVQGISVSRMLEELNISRCSTLHVLNLAQLDCLRKVKIENCKDLTSLTGISNLPKLVELSISSCSKLQLELHLVGLNFLKKIAVDLSVVIIKCFGLDGCKNLEMVSGAGIDFRKIQMFNISACPELRELPVICGANRLQTITVNGCVKLNYLKLIDCRTLQRISGILELAVLSIKDCPILEGLPCLGNMTRLKEIHIIQCGKLQNISLPMTLKRLELNACGGLKSLSGISALKELVELNIRACPELYELGVAHLSKLEKLAIANLEKVSGISNLTTLLELEISECRDIEFELCLSGMSCLENIAIIKSEKMQTMTLPPSLTKLTLEACRGLKEIAGISDITKLWELNIKNCPDLQVDLLLSGLKSLYRISVEYCNIPNMTLPVALRELKVQSCKKLQRITELEDLTELTELYIIECPALEEIPSLARASHFERIKIVLCDMLQIITLPTTIIKLTVQDCRHLQRISGMSNSTEVVELCISDCPELEELPVICGSNCLERVSIDGCGKLSSLQLTDCRILKGLWGTFAQLQICDCVELQELPCFAHLTCLEGIRIFRCEKLQEITLPSNLKLLHLEGCTELQSVSKISQFNNLVQLIISECRQLELNLNLVGMNSLQSIALDGCGKLKSFVLNRCCNLKKVLGSFDVERLSICDCPELEELTVCYCCLETVHIESCDKLQSITLPKKLTKLILQICRCLPRIEGMDSLTELYIGECDELDVLPILFGLSRLIRVEIDSCQKLHNMTLPATLSELSVHQCSWQVMEYINNLTKLTKMSISECLEFEELPSLSEMRCLEILNIDSCERLNKITLPATLMKLTVSRCRKLKRVVETANLTKLIDIFIFDCPELKELPNLSKMFCLESIRFDYSERLHNITLPITLNKLSVQGSRGLQIVVGINNLTKLTEISISKCPELEELPNISEMRCLESVQISSCESLRTVTLPTTLVKFRATDCRELQRLAGIGNFTRLTDMVISKCPELEELPNLCEMCCLESISIDDCKRLHNITLPSTLIKLSVHGCERLEMMGGISNLTQLTMLSISVCLKLKKLNLSDMSYLEYISIDSCDLLQDLTLPSTIMKLSVRRCKRLRRVAETSNLTKLTDMVISDCSMLKELPNLSEISCMESVDINQCKRLREIALPATLGTLRVCFCGGLKRVTGTDYPTQVECTDIRGCPNLEELPCLARLKSISVDSCEKLENIAGIGEMKSLEGMQLLFCSDAAIQGCIRKLKSLPLAFINLIGKAANGAMSNLNPSLLPEAISCADPATLSRTIDYLKGSVSAIIVSSLVEASGSAPLAATEISPSWDEYERPGQWMITTVIKRQHYKAAEYYSYMHQENFFAFLERKLAFVRFDQQHIFNANYLQRGEIERWCAWVVRTDEDWRTLPALIAVVDKLHHK